MKLQFTGTVEVPDVVFEAYKPTPIAQAQYIGECAGAFTPIVEPDFGPYAGKLAYLEADYVNKDGSQFLPTKTGSTRLFVPHLEPFLASSCVLATTATKSRPSLSSEARSGA